jgi:hypothetical protein
MEQVCYVINLNEEVLVITDFLKLVDGIAQDINASLGQSFTNIGKTLLSFAEPKSTGGSITSIPHDINSNPIRFKWGSINLGDQVSNINSSSLPALNKRPLLCPGLNIKELTTILGSGSSLLLLNILAGNINNFMDKLWNDDYINSVIANTRDSFSVFLQQFPTIVDRIRDMNLPASVLTLAGITLNIIWRGTNITLTNNDNVDIPRNTDIGPHIYETYYNNLQSHYNDNQTFRLNANLGLENLVGSGDFSLEIYNYPENHRALNWYVTFLQDNVDQLRGALDFLSDDLNLVGYFTGNNIEPFDIINFDGAAVDFFEILSPQHFEEVHQDLLNLLETKSQILALLQHILQYL